MRLEDKQFDSGWDRDRSGYGVPYLISLDERVPDELAEEVSDKLAYASDKARSARLSEDRVRVEIVLDDAAHLERVTEQVRSLVSALIRGYREVDKPIL